VLAAGRHATPRSPRPIPDHPRVSGPPLRTPRSRPRRPQHQRLAMMSDLPLLGILMLGSAAVARGLPVQPQCRWTSLRPTGRLGPARYTSLVRRPGMGSWIALQLVTRTETIRELGNDAGQKVSRGITGRP